MLKKLWGNFKTITTHKIKVMKLCFKCGLYKQGLLHDLSKYSWIEFKAGVKYYQGNRSPISYEKEVLGYSRAWLHHKGRNKHHFEYWLDNINGVYIPIKMEKRYVFEMFCDRVIACQVYEKENYRNDSALNYFFKKGDRHLMHPKTANLLEKLLTMLKDQGLDTVIQYIRQEIKTNLQDY